MRTANYIKEIVRGRVAKKPRINKSHAHQRKEFCEHTLKELANGAIYICSDEKYHEVGAKSGGENVTRPKRVDAERYSIPKARIQFTIMQFGSHTTEEEPVMGPIHLWKARTDKERKEFNAERAVKNQKIKEEAKEQCKQALISGTRQFMHMQVGELYNPLLFSAVLLTNLRRSTSRSLIIIRPGKPPVIRATRAESTSANQSRYILPQIKRKSVQDSESMHSYT
jgi:hypothetical protein